MKKSVVVLCGILLVLWGSGTANGTLWDRGGGLYYDDVSKITWLQDANYAKTSGYDPDGRMHWAEAMQWASNLTYGGYTEWRLPSVTNFDGTPYVEGYVQTGSEMGHLFYVDLGNAGWGQGTFKTFPFINLQKDYYWYQEEGPLVNCVWYFNFALGYQNGMSIHDGMAFALAVHDGDIAAPVPEPATMLLLASGLMGIAGFRKRFRTQ